MPVRCDQSERVVAPRCWQHLAHDVGEPRAALFPRAQLREEVAHAVLQLGLIGTVRRLAPGRR